MWRWELLAIGVGSGFDDVGIGSCCFAFGHEGNWWGLTDFFVSLYFWHSCNEGFYFLLVFERALLQSVQLLFKWLVLLLDSLIGVAETGLSLGWVEIVLGLFCSQGLWCWACLSEGDWIVGIFLFQLRFNLCAGFQQFISVMWVLHICIFIRKLTFFVPRRSLQLVVNVGFRRQ